MITPRVEKGKKSSPAKKLIPEVRAKKKMTKPMEKKPLKKTTRPASPKEEIKSAPARADETAATRALLLEMREKLIAEISENLKADFLAPSTEIGDVLDQAGDERDRELSLLLTDRDKEKLLAINEALEKLREGTYGICEECGERIGPGRLKVLPLAKLCVSCQSNLEEEMNLQRKMEEDLKYRGLAYTSGVEGEEEP